jgi:hypothetical protein
MADAIKLSKAYGSRDDAAMGGFRKVMKNSNVWLTKEFGFWVILKVGKDKSLSYFYTDPDADGTGEVTLTVPEGLMVRAFCHTHPHRIAMGDFSTGDKQHFQDLQKVRPGIVWYLLNPAQEIRLAVDEAEFPAGTPVKWSSSVTP